jgi:hypothetical protein
MSFFSSGQPIVIPDPVDVGVQSVAAGSNVTITGTATVPIVNAVGTVASIIAGSNITVSGTSNVTINSFNFNNFVSYNVGGGFTASPFTITDLSNNDFKLITTVDSAVSYPQAGAAYQLTFSWVLKNASFASAPSGNVYALVLSGPTLATGTVIGQSACFVNANIGNSPPNAGPVALGTCSCLIYNDNGTDVSIAFANFSGQDITAAELQIFSVSVTFLSGNPSVVNDF